MLINKRIIVTIAGLGAASLLLIGAGIVPTLYSIGNLETKIDEQNTAIEKRYITRQLVRDTMTALEENKDVIAGLKKVAVLDGQELDFVNALESLQEKTGVDANISLATVNQKDVSQWERQIPIQLTLTGEYPGVLRFIEGIERLPYFIIIDNVNVTALNSGTSAKAGLIRTELSGYVYWISKKAPSFVTTGSLAPLP